MFSRRSAWPFLLLSVGVALGATLPRAHPAPVEDCTGPGIVFMLPGAGGSWEVACNLRCVIRGMGLPLRVVEVPWTHGVNNNVEDVQDHANHQIWGCRLAQWITWYRQHNPGHKVYVVGYSAAPPRCSLQPTTCLPTALSAWSFWLPASILVMTCARP